MKVILNSDIKGVGKKNEIINASDGYARNYLFPKKLAVPADTQNMNVLNAKKASEQHKKDLECEEAKKVQEKMKTIVLKITTKAGENGKTFGSITSKEIAESLEKQFKIKVDKKKVVLPEQIKTLGTYIVDVKLYEGVVGKLTVSVTE
ncbi:MAG: 50S ribosomal protein L9 [Clostridia bacterium]|nr:50S ribosomal protein L9 [Clostridia bacterium]